MLSVAGEVDLATTPALEREALHVLHNADRRLILDLSHGALVTDCMTTAVQALSDLHG